MPYVFICGRQYIILMSKYSTLINNYHLWSRTSSQCQRVYVRVNSQKVSRKETHAIKAHTSVSYFGGAGDGGSMTKRVNEALNFSINLSEVVPVFP